MDREITRRAFAASVRLEVAGFIVATVVTFICLGLMTGSLFLLDYPASIAGAIVAGLGGAAPVITIFLARGRRQGEAPPPEEPR